MRKKIGVNKRFHVSAVLHNAPSPGAVYFFDDVSIQGGRSGNVSLTLFSSLGVISRVLVPAFRGEKSRFFPELVKSSKRSLEIDWSFINFVLRRDF